MMLKAFALLDAKVQAFHTPFFMAHVGHAIRACSELGQDRNTVVGRHPADFILFEIGVFNDQTAGMMPLAAPINHGPVVTFLPPPSPTFDFDATSAPSPETRVTNGHAPA